MYAELFHATKAKCGWKTAFNRIWVFQVVHSSFVAFVLVIRKIFMEVEVGRKNPICSSPRGTFTSRSLMLRPSQSDTPVSIGQFIY